MAPSIRKMGEINIMKLINSIKVRPALYNKDDSMYYSHKKFKYKLWREVCQEVYRNWDCLAPHDKLEYARELQKRWKSLRTCFAREVAFQKKEKIKKEKNEPYKKRKKYEYFNSLIFLLNPETIEEYIVNDSDTDEDPLEPNANTAVEYTTMDFPNVESDQDITTFSNTDKEKAGTTSQIKTETPYVEPVGFEKTTDDKFMDMLREIRSSESDEDRMFVLSLVSIFKNLNPRKKMEARIEVLKLLQKITCRNDDNEHQYPY